jgi:transposase-like protein
MKAVSQALRPNADIGVIAQKHGIHSNLLRQWITAVKLAFPRS